MAFLAVFSLLLASCMLLHADILWALAAGYVLCFSLALRRGLSVREVLRCSAEGVRDALPILRTFLVIGVLTAYLRAAGTIATIVRWACTLVGPGWFLCLTFLLNCLLSFLTGTSFGTAATMGVLSMSLARSLGVDPAWCGGAVLSGIFFGDRCGPTSTSAQLVAALTHTDLYGNVRGMLRRGWIPWLLSALAYLVLGFFVPQDGSLSGDPAWIPSGMRLGWVALLPAAVLALFVLLRRPVRQAMLAAIVCAFWVMWGWQGAGFADLVRWALFGFDAPDGMLDGGGVVSMVHTALVVALSSSYFGLFTRLGVLDGLKRRIASLGRIWGSMAVLVPVSLGVVAVSCNQTLATMLVSGLAEPLYPEPRSRALALEDGVILIAAWVPWSVAVSAPLAMIGAPVSSIAFAWFLLLVPVFAVGREALYRKRSRG